MSHLHLVSPVFLHEGPSSADTFSKNKKNTVCSTGAIAEPNTEREATRVQLEIVQNPPEDFLPLIFSL